MNFDDENNKENQEDQENIFGTPEDRENEDYQLHKTTVTKILSNAELNKMGGNLPSSRVVSYLVNGIPVEETQILCRVDELGRIIPANDVSGISWGTNEPIPIDCRACCLNPFDLHDYKLVYLFRDGHVTEKGNVLCTECLEWQRKRIFWKTVLLFGLLYNPKIY
jgi:hypothetical protein